MENYRILLINFDSSLQSVSSFFLNKPGCITVLASSHYEALQQLTCGPYDLAVLNMRSDPAGDTAFLAEASKVNATVIKAVLAEDRTFETVLQLFRLGIRDYILKSEGKEAVLERLAVLLEQVSQQKHHQYCVAQMQSLLAQLQTSHGGSPEGKFETVFPSRRDNGRFLRRGMFTVDLGTRQVAYKAKTAILTQGTFNYFVVLLKHAPNPVQHQILVFEAQGHEVVTDEALGIAKWHIHQLRSTFKNTFGEDLIETIRGTGYRVKIAQEPTLEPSKN